VRRVWTSVVRMAQPGEWTTDRLAAALSDPRTRVLRVMAEGVAISGGEPPGSCVLVVDGPVVRRLTELPRERRIRFLADLEQLGEAVHNVCERRDGGLLGVDLHIPGGGDLLHALLCPRYAGPASAPDPHDDVHRELSDELDRIDAARRADYPARHVYGLRRPR
jgi:hypothetical protein